MEKKAKGGKRYLPLLFFPLPSCFLNPSGPSLRQFGCWVIFLDFLLLGTSVNR